MKPSSIIDSRLFIPLDLNNAKVGNSLFQNDKKNEAHLANQLLLYDKIVIPTKDFGIVPALLNWLGVDFLREALDTNSLAFLHRRSMLAYVGNGGGINTFVMSGSVSRKFEWWQTALFGKLDEALELQLSNMCSYIPKQDRQLLMDKIILNAKEVEYNNDFFMKNIVQEAYTDIMQKEEFSTFVLETCGQNVAHIDLNRLPGLAENQMRVLNVNILRDPIDLVLRIAEINMEIYMSTLADNADLFTSQGAEELLKHKLVRAGIGSNYIEGFLSLLDLNNIPDIGEAVKKGNFSLGDIWKIREKTNSKKFREWLKKATSKDAKEIVRFYIDSINNNTLTDSLPLRGYRFVITALLGATNPLLGLAGSAIDSFFVDKWLKGYSPKLFLDELSKLRGKT